MHNIIIIIIIVQRGDLANNMITELVLDIHGLNKHHL